MWNTKIIISMKNSIGFAAWVNDIFIVSTNDRKLSATEKIWANIIIVNRYFNGEMYDIVIMITKEAIGADWALRNHLVNHKT